MPAPVLSGGHPRPFVITCRLRALPTDGRDTSPLVNFPAQEGRAESSVSENHSWEGREWTHKGKETLWQASLFPKKPT